MDRRETVSLVIPLFNEVEAVSYLIREIELFRAERPDIVEIILVDDGSSDGTSSKIRDLTQQLPGYKLISFSRNFGHQLAITAGLEVVESDAAVILDADLQDPLSTVSTMVEKWKEGFDVVYGVRIARKGESAFKRATASLFYRFFRIMTDVSMPVDAGDFRLISREVIDVYREMGEQKPFVRGMISWLGFNQVGVSYTRAERIAGTTKYTLRKMLRLATDSLTSFSEKPLQLAVRLGLFVSVASVLFAGVWVILAKYVFETAITGWASMMLVVAFFGGLNLFFIGLIGLYLSRVFDETKGRPRWVVKSSWSSDDAERDRALSGNSDDTWKNGEGY
jgi:dolichol-phosphate mannosyltransferase